MTRKLAKVIGCVVVLGAGVAVPSSALAQSSGCSVKGGANTQICAASFDATAGTPSHYAVAQYADFSNCNFPPPGNEPGNNGNYTVAEVAINWGDGTPPTSGTAVTGTTCPAASRFESEPIEGTHDYQTSGTYAVSVSITYVRGDGDTFENCATWTPGDTTYNHLTNCIGIGAPVQSTATVANGSPPSPSGPVASTDGIQQVVFVHGIRASCATPGTGEYKALYDALAEQGSSVYTFCYDHDLAFGERSSGVSGQPNRCFSNSGRQVATIASTANLARERETSPHHIGPLYVSSNIGSARERDDGDSALAYSAAKLDDCLGALVRYDVATYGHALPIAVIGNSMGGAITRGWLELARSRNSTSLDGVTTVFLLEAATQGSWVAGLGANVNELATSLPSPPGIPSGAVGSIVSTVLQESVATFQPESGTGGGTRSSTAVGVVSLCRGRWPASALALLLPVHRYPAPHSGPLSVVDRRPGRHRLSRRRDHAAWEPGI